ncbi:MAG TPA: hypothetical protein VME43_19620, partial [Bryobacteraceae bacterium]|nr:hypothetical protein [Bryobacteraceae bacterium]
MLRLADSNDAHLMILGLRLDDLTPEVLAGYRHCPTVPSFAALLAAPVELVAAVAPALAADLAAAGPRLRAELPASGGALVILVPYKPPPSEAMRGDGFVDSFLASAPLLRAIGAARRDPPLETLCYRVLSAVASGEACVDRLLVRQLPNDAARPVPAAISDARAAVIMPHRGNIRHLETALRYLGKSTGMPLSVRVGLDVERPAVYRPLAGAPAEFYAAHPAGCGPYVIRQALINRSLEAALVWQDSDDIPCADRFVTLWSEIESSGCDLAGSHELRLNEL